MKDLIIYTYAGKLVTLLRQFVIFTQL